MTVIIDFDAGTTLVRRGECNQCGLCCDTMVRHDLCAHMPKHGVWRQLKNGTWYRSTEVVMASGRCQYLTDDNLCSIHEHKPDMCSEYPLTPSDLIPGCSYIFERQTEND